MGTTNMEEYIKSYYPNNFNNFSQLKYSSNNSISLKAFVLCKYGTLNKSFLTSEIITYKIEFKFYSKFLVIQ